MSENLPNHVPVTPGECSTLLQRILVGAYILRLEYLRTGWEIEFDVNGCHEAIATGLLAHPNTVILQAVEVLFERGRVLHAGLGAEDELRQDALTARALINCMSHAVSSVSVSDSATITMSFSCEHVFKLSGSFDPFEEVWTLYQLSDRGVRRGFGELCIAQSYFGELTADPRWLKSDG